MLRLVLADADVEQDQPGDDHARGLADAAEGECALHRLSPSLRSPWMTIATRKISIAVAAIISSRPKRRTCSTVAPLGGSAMRNMRRPSRKVPAQTSAKRIAKTSGLMLMSRRR